MLARYRLGHRVEPTPKVRHKAQGVQAVIVINNAKRLDGLERLMRQRVSESGPDGFGQLALSILEVARGFSGDGWTARLVGIREVEPSISFA